MTAAAAVLSLAASDARADSSAILSQIANLANAPISNAALRNMLSVMTQASVQKNGDVLSGKLLGPGFVDPSSVIFYGAPLTGSSDDGGAFSAARAASRVNGVVRVPGGAFYPLSGVSGGPTTPILWQLSGLCYDTACTAPVTSVGANDTTENFFGGTKYFGRQHGSVPTFRIDTVSDVSGSGARGPVPGVSINGSYGTAASPGATVPGFLWPITCALQTFAVGGEPVCAYMQTHKMVPGVGAWSGVDELASFTGAPSSIDSGMTTHEFDLTGNGLDNGTCNAWGCRQAIQVVVSAAPVQGIASTSITAPGSGYTTGTYPLGVTATFLASTDTDAAGSAPQGFANRAPTGTFTVSGGVISSIAIIDPGANVKTASLSFPGAGGSGAAATATLGYAPYQAGTIFDVGARPGQGSIKTVLRMENATPVSDAIINTAGASMSAGSAIIKATNCQNVVDFTGDSTHTLTYCNGNYSFNVNGIPVFNLYDAGGLRVPTFSVDPGAANAFVDGSIYYNTTAKALKRYNAAAAVWQFIEPQFGTPASSTAACTQGDRQFDTAYTYVCVTTGAAGSAKWGRTALATTGW